MIPLLIAHRGYPAVFPENTILSFSKAIEAGATWIELDVHTCATGEVVVIHDENLARTTTLHGEVRNTTHEEIKSALIIHNGAITNERVETLETILTSFNTVNVCIEIKGQHTGSAVESLFNEKPELLLNRAIVLSSFKKNVIEAIRIVHPNLKKAVTLWGTPTIKEIEVYRSIGATALHIDWNDEDITEELIASCHDRDIAVWVYTVNDVQKARELAGMGCDGIFTDDFPLITSVLH